MATESLERYARQLPIIGLEGQKKLSQARVLIVGAGGLGNIVAPYLVAAGLGELCIADHDKVERSNLQRQIYFDESMLGKNKAQCLQERLQALNPTVRVEAWPVRLDDSFSSTMLGSFDAIVDASDNYPTRYVLNAFSHRLGTPLIAAALYQMEGQLSVFNYQSGPCYQCLYPSPPEENLIPNCAMGGILGATAGMFGALQAVEVIKVIGDMPGVLSGHLLTANLSNHHYQRLRINRAENCQELHGDMPILPRATKMAIPSIQVKALQTVLQRKPEAIQLLDVREDYEREICSIGGIAIPLGTLPHRLAELDATKKTICYCKSGTRSQQAARLLKQQGFAHVFSLEGGILQWIAEIDPQMTRY